MTILCVGIACLDIVHVCSSYPSEDSKTRSTDHWWQRGGNASNSCTVLCALGARCEFLGTLGTGPNARFVQGDLRACGIRAEHCPVHAGCDTPTSVVIISSSNGSRTVVHHNKDLLELELEDFTRLDLAPYSWVHFEGRNVAAVAGMMEHAARWSASGALRISVELEKVRRDPDTSVLLPLADCVFVGRDFARSSGWDSALQALRAVAALTKPGATVVVAWGKEGAVGRGPDGAVVRSPAFPPARVVDTLGAGDTFNATTICALRAGRSLQDSIALGCRVAGAKVGAHGFAHLAQTFSALATSLWAGSAEQRGR
ncbi:ketohexokinase-like isoform X2 [Bacillus rossius redtenbacheri]|uniref:ketohexokinase-like isoform X2 n=1 Tax=Bacillus rossius redtenbacheri TaxID=93214 RepID=UPI002FDE98C3